MSSAGREARGGSRGVVGTCRFRDIRRRRAKTRHARDDWSKRFTPHEHGDVMMNPLVYT